MRSCAVLALLFLALVVVIVVISSAHYSIADNPFMEFERGQMMDKAFQKYLTADITPDLHAYSGVMLNVCANLFVVFGIAALVLIGLRWLGVLRPLARLVEWIWEEV